MPSAVGKAVKTLLREDGKAQFRCGGQTIKMLQVLVFAKLKKWESLNKLGVLLSPLLCRVEEFMVCYLKINIFIHLFTF